MTYSWSSPLTCNATLPGPSLAEACGASAFVVFMSLLDELIRSNEKISGRCERVEPVETPDEEYDFVVVGGGGAGAVVAGRLSEIPDWKVLVLEAGRDEPAGTGVPQLFGAFVGSEVDWNFTTTNESYACLTTNGSCRFPSGKMLGGSTSYSVATYFRGNPMDYNNWAALGNEGWTWEEVESFFIMSEDNGDIEEVGRKHHGTGGLLSVERVPYFPPFGYSCLAALSEAGYTFREDLNGDRFTGFTIVQTTTKNGVRQSSASAYLRPVRNRKNLHVSLNSRATRVMIENDKAVGVEYYQGGELKTVRASREVILSAGVVMSPQILLLSGIGPEEHLESVRVEVVKDLPGVGENLQNHFGYNFNFTINEADKYDNDWAIATEYLVNQTGPLSGIGLNSVMAMLNTETALSNYPDFQLYWFGYLEGCAPGEISALRSTKKRTVFVRATLLQPKSRGRITLASNDPFEYPIILGNYLADSRDVDRLLKAMKKTLAMSETTTLRAHNLTLSNTPIEACSDFKFKSDDYWKCAMHQDTHIDAHYVGTCKMGPSSDPMAVVDPQLRVHGIKGLRVADASITPQIPSANPAAPVIMIGERAADFIKKDWAQESGKRTPTRGSSRGCYLVAKKHFP